MKSDKFTEDVKITIKHIKSKCITKLMNPTRLDDGLYSATVLQESLNWQKVVVANTSFNIFEEAIWKFVQQSDREVRRSGDATRFSAYFYTLASFTKFWQSFSGQRNFKFQELVGCNSSTIFVCPYMLVTKTFNEHELCTYQEVYTKNGWMPPFVGTEVATGKLKCQYKGLNPQLGFVLDEFHEKYANGKKKGIFYDVIIPDDACSLVQLMPGVKFRGKRGVIPAPFIVQRNARLPVLRYVDRKGKLNTVDFAFRAFQVVNHQLQWKTRPLSWGDADSSDEDGEIKLTIPRGFKRFEAGMTEEFLDGGFLAQQQPHLLFKLYDNEWKHFQVVKFIPEQQRNGEVFTYIVRIVGGCRGQLPVLFDVEKYDCNATNQAELGT